MFQGFFEWVMGVITYVLSFFGITISKPATGGGVAQVTDAEEAVAPASLSSDSSE